MLSGLSVGVITKRGKKGVEIALGSGDFVTLYPIHSHPPSPTSVITLYEMSGKTHLERAINQIQSRGPAPDIDFTQHQLENGYTISTQERVVKEVLLHLCNIDIF